MIPVIALATVGIALVVTILTTDHRLPYLGTDSSGDASRGASFGHASYDRTSRF
jgi:hypothetical protein